MSSSNDSAIFLPSEELKTVFQELEIEFEEQVESLISGPIQNDDDVLLVDKDQFMSSFRTHAHRYQQMYLLLKDMNLLHSTMLEIKFMTIVTTPDYKDGMKLPVIRQDDDHMFVGFEAPPVRLDDELIAGEGDLITVATVPLLPTDTRPYNGRSVITTGLAEEMEIVLVMQDDSDRSVILMWGQFVLNQLHQKTPDPSTLN